MEEEKFKRYPAVEKLISEIEPSKDIRVRVIGTIVEKNEDSSSIVLDDGVSSLSIIIPSDKMLNSIEVGKRVRVIGTIIPLGDDFELKAEIISDFSELDYALFLKIHSKTAEI